MGLFGTAWDFLGLFETAWDFLGLFGTALDSFEAAWDFLGLFDVWDALGLFAAWDFLGLFGTAGGSLAFLDVPAVRRSSKLSFLPLLNLRVILHVKGPSRYDVNKILGGARNL